MLSFTDSILDGEQFGGAALKDDYLEMLPPDLFRAEFMGHNWGPIDYFLPEFRDPYTSSATPTLAAYVLLHDVNPWPTWSDASVWNRMYAAVDAVGINEARFQPYWGEARVKAPAEVLVSSYVASGGTVLAVMNTGETTLAALALDLPGLGLAQVGSAVDAVTGEALAASGSTLTVPLARHQGRVVVLKP
jgi:hypothetical protein